MVHCRRMVRWFRGSAIAGPLRTLLEAAGCAYDYGATLGAQYRYPEQMSF